MASFNVSILFETPPNKIAGIQNVKTEIPLQKVKQTTALPLD